LVPSCSSCAQLAKPQLLCTLMPIFLHPGVAGLSVHHTMQRGAPWNTELLGTVAYTAPEVLLDASNLQMASDVYAFGLMSKHPASLSCMLLPSLPPSLFSPPSSLSLSPSPPSYPLPFLFLLPSSLVPFSCACVYWYCLPIIYFSTAYVLLPNYAMLQD
jgi:serine/threonine protein kinase